MVAFVDASVPRERGDVVLREPRTIGSTDRCFGRFEGTRLCSLGGVVFMPSHVEAGSCGFVVWQGNNRRMGTTLFLVVPFAGTVQPG